MYSERALQDSAWSFSLVSGETHSFLIPSYGELGYRILMMKLHQLFNSSLDSVRDQLSLTPTDIIEKVLLPYAVVNLIAEDLHISTDQAAIVAEESSEFGRKYHQDEDV